MTPYTERQVDAAVKLRLVEEECEQARVCAEDAASCAVRLAAELCEREAELARIRGEVAHLRQAQGDAALLARTRDAEATGLRAQLTEAMAEKLAIFDRLTAANDEMRVVASELEGRNLELSEHSQACHIEIGDYARQLDEIGDRLRTALDHNARTQRELERARRCAEAASAAKSRFLAATSHDLRQPFQAMRILIDLLAERQPPGKARLLAARLDEAIAAGEGLLDRMLDISVIDAGMLTPKVAPVDLAELTGRLAAEFKLSARAKGLVLRHRPLPVTVASDCVQLERILRNLLANAVRYTDRGGILLAIRRHGGAIWLEVWDTGPGIPPEELDAVFEEFHQLSNPARDRHQGLGLGLSIVQRLVRLLGLDMVLRSRLGRGSVFRVMLPAPAVVVEVY